MLAVWASGLAAGAAVVAWWRIVGPGYLWLALGVTAGAGAIGAASGGGLPAWIGVFLAVVGVGVARSPRLVVPCSAGATVALASAAMGQGRPLLVLTGALFLGGVTSVMMLGHWYLVDPRLPRSALRTLDVAAGLGTLLDVVAVVVLRSTLWGEADGVVLTAWVALAVTTALLLAGVWFALGERGYSGVMAATGLSYLAVLTAIGVVVVGRILAAGPGTG